MPVVRVSARPHRPHAAFPREAAPCTWEYAPQGTGNSFWEIGKEGGEERQRKGEGTERLEFPALRHLYFLTWQQERAREMCLYTYIHSALHIYRDQVTVLSTISRESEAAEGRWLGVTVSGLRSEHSLERQRAWLCVSGGFLCPQPLCRKTRAQLPHPLCQDPLPGCRVSVKTWPI